MSYKYNKYLEDHITYVRCAFDWIKDNLGEDFLDDLFPDLKIEGLNSQIHYHDESKYTKVEYGPYDRYFYYNDNKDPKIEEEFNKAWLHHIHNNPHHWQHWVLVQDDGDINNNQKLVAIEMPDNYILEMVCDWWSFSWGSNDLFEIFSWYDSHKDKMVLHPKTKNKVEKLLTALNNSLNANTSESNESNPDVTIIES